MLYETERQKMASNSSVPGVAGARTRRGVERCPLLRTAAASNTQKGDELDKNEAGRGEHVTLRHVTSGSRQVKQNP